MAERAIIGGVVAPAMVVAGAPTTIVSWAAGREAKLAMRLNNIEEKVDNDIAGRRIVAELRANVAAIKSTLTELKNQVRRLAPGQP